MSRARIRLVAEVTLAVALAGSGILQVHGMEAGALEGGPAVQDVLVLGCVLPLLARRRHAAAVFCCVVASSWVQFELGGGLGQPFFAVLVALYAVGAEAPLPASLLGPAAVLATVVLIDVPRLRDGAPPDEVVPAWFVLGGVWGFGRWMRHRHRDAALLVARAEAAERGARERAEQAVGEERARIARELHDLVAHSMGVIVIQAQGAQRVLDSDTDRSRAALRTIESAGRDGLSEMRRLLGLLTDPAQAATVAPQPSLHTLPELVERVRSSGLRVDLAIEGDVRDLAPGVELTAYRVVQEALTNVLKHAPGAEVDVRLCYERDRLHVTVHDGGSSAPLPVPERGGHGLVAMRERVTLYGGTLVTGPDGDGYTVSAHLPLEDAP